MKQLKYFILFILMSYTVPLMAGVPVYGIIYLKNHKQILVDGEDRIDVPKHREDLVVTHHFFSKKNQRTERIKNEDVNRIVVWHPDHPKNKFIFRMLDEKGWCIESGPFKHIKIYVYSQKGYKMDYLGDLDTNILNIVGPIFTRVEYYLQKEDSPEILLLGDVYMKANSTFKDKLARYVADDYKLSETIRTSKLKSRVEILRLLAKYKPGTRM